MIIMNWLIKRIMTFNVAKPVSLIDRMSFHANRKGMYFLYVVARKLLGGSKLFYLISLLIHTTLEFIGLVF